MTLLEQMRAEERKLHDEWVKLTTRLEELRKWMSKEMDFDSARKPKQETKETPHTNLIPTQLG